MKFKKIREKYGIFKLGCRIADGCLKTTHYEVWDRDIDWGNICGGVGIEKREWDFVPANVSASGIEQLGLSSDQLKQITKKIDELNAKR